MVGIINKSFKVNSLTNNMNEQKIENKIKWYEVSLAWKTCEYITREYTSWLRIEQKEKYNKYIFIRIIGHLEAQIFHIFAWILIQIESYNV